MLSEAKQYCSDRDCRRRQPVYSANRFCRLIGDIPASDVTAEHLDQYRQQCLKLGLAAKTIESSLSDLIAICRHCTGSAPAAGRRLKIPRPEPDPVPISSIDAVWPIADPWLRQWIILTYWTTLRLTDCMRLQLTLTETAPTDALRFRASKTGHRHGWPVPDWLRPWLTKRPLPYTNATDFARKILRAVLTSHCEQAAVPRWGPKALRQRAITEWVTASRTAGEIVHGQGLGVLAHYVDPAAMIAPYQHRVRLPAAFGAAPATDDISVQYHRLDPQAQRLVSETIARLA